MNIVKRNDWIERLEKERKERKKEEAEKNHPLAAAKQDHAAANAKVVPSPFPESTGTGGGLVDESFTVPSELRDEAIATRDELRDEANKRTEAGEAEREAANAAGSSLFEAMSAFSKKQDGRYDDLYSKVLANDYKSDPVAREILYEYLRSAQGAAADAAASHAAESGGAGDSYSAALAARTKSEKSTAGEAAAREYYSDYLDRILSVLKATGSDMNTAFGYMQDNVDTAQKAASTDLTLGAQLLEALADAETAERRIEANTFSELLSKGNTTQNMEISPMKLDEEYAVMTGDGENGGYTEEQALMILWDKYPTMRSLIFEKYVEVKDDYTFTT